MTPPLNKRRNSLRWRGEIYKEIGNKDKPNNKEK